MTFELVPGADLRQGDVCTVEHFPRWDLAQAMNSTMADGTAKYIQIPTWDRVAQPVASRERLVVVCSYDCDIENPRARSGILIAPILPVSARDPRLNDIMASGTPQGDAAGQLSFSYLNLFPLSLPSPEGSKTYVTADLSAITSIAPAPLAIDRLLGSKKFELTEVARKAFRTKLAVFVGRPELS